MVTQQLCYHLGVLYDSEILQTTICRIQDWQLETWSTARRRKNKAWIWWPVPVSMYSQPIKTPATNTKTARTIQKRCQYCRGS